MGGFVRLYQLTLFGKVHDLYDIVWFINNNNTTYVAVFKELIRLFGFKSNINGEKEV